jgi:oxygen-independent coproporphyrinogen-3 oxidase
LYIKKITNNEAFNEIELLKNEDKVNDYILTRLRTIWGVNINDIGNIDAKYKNIVRQKMQKFINSGELVKLSDTLFILSNSGKYRADGIAADLFV